METSTKETTACVATVTTPATPALTASETVTATKTASASTATATAAAIAATTVNSGGQRWEWLLLSTTCGLEDLCVEEVLELIPSTSTCDWKAFVINFNNNVNNNNNNSNVDDNHSNVDNNYSNVDNNHSNVDNNHSNVDNNNSNVDNNHSNVDNNYSNVDNNYNNNNNNEEANQVQVAYEVNSAAVVMHGPPGTARLCTTLRTVERITVLFALDNCFSVENKNLDDNFANAKSADIQSMDTPCLNAAKMDTAATNTKNMDDNSMGSIGAPSIDTKEHARIRLKSFALSPSTQYFTECTRLWASFVRHGQFQANSTPAQNGIDSNATITCDKVAPIDTNDNSDNNNNSSGNNDSNNDNINNNNDNNNNNINKGNDNNNDNNNNNNDNNNNNNNINNNNENNNDNNISNNISETDVGVVSPISFRATCRRVRWYPKLHGLESVGMAGKVADGLIDRFNWSVSLKEYEMDVYVLSSGPILAAGFVLVEGLDKRTKRNDSPVSQLRGSLSAALVRAARIQPGFVVVDPMAGSGTLPIEAALMHPEASVIGADISVGEIQDANKLSQKLGLSNVTFRIEDVRHEWMPNGSIDRIVTDPPFGQRHLTASKVKRLYPMFVQRAADALRRGSGKILVLTICKNIMIKAVDGVKELEVLSMRDADVGGFHAWLFEIRRLSEKEVGKRRKRNDEEDDDEKK